MLDLEELHDAYEWVNVDSTQNSAFVSRSTGEICWSSREMELEGECPEDLDVGGEYLRIPGKYDLDLGNSLAFEFVDLHAPEAQALVAGFFRKRGAYARFKDFLERKGLLQLWYDYQEQRIRHALRKWAEDNGLLSGATP